MNPISLLTYYRRHKGGTALLVVIIALVTLAVGMMVSVLDSYIENMTLDLAYLDSVSAIYPALGQELDPGIAAQVRAQPDIERVIPESGFTINHPMLIGSYSIRVFVIPVGDMPVLLHSCGLRVIQGRLPEANAPELALSLESALSLGLQLGDRVSRAANSEYYGALATEVTLVGLLDQDPVVEERNVRLGLISYEYILGHEDYTSRISGLLIIPRSGRIAAINDLLERLPDSLTVSETKSQVAATIERMASSLRSLFAIVNLLVAGVVAVVVGIINQIAITHRLPEFGLLQAVGWRKTVLLRRVTGGTAMTAAIGWLVGLAVMVALVALGRDVLFEPRGQEWTLSIVPFLYTLPIPLAVIAFAAGSVWRVFHRLDAVAIIERGKLSMEENIKQHTSHSLVRPLSSWIYYRRHRRRGILLVATMALMILGVAFPVFVLLPIFDSQLPSMGYLRMVTQVLPGGGALDPGVIAQIRAHPTVARVIPVWYLYMRISVPPFSGTAAPLFAVYQEDMQSLIERFDLHLLEGRLPQPRTNEVVLSEALALNRGLHVGDSIGYPVYERDWFPIALTIVGLLETDGMWVGFTSLEYMQSHELTSDLYTTRLLVVPVADKAALETWLLDNVASSTTLIETYDSEWRRLQHYRVGGLQVLGMVLFLVAIIAAAALAVLNYIFYSQRRDEFGILHAVGCNLGWLTWRAARETLVTTAAAWLIGAALCVGLILYLQLAVYIPKGLSMDLTSLAPWLFTLPIPLAVAAVSVGTIGWMLKRLDPVAVIERR